jgi:biotin carboxylase
MNKALVLGAGFYYTRALSKIKEGGYYLIAVDRDPRAPGASVADEFHPIDICDIDGVLGLAREKKPHCVVPLNEFGMRTHAAVCRDLGLPGVEPEQAEMVVDKAVMRRAWSQAGLRQPRFRPVRDLRQARRAAGEIGFPCVIKPADSGGSGRGVLVLNRPEDVEEGVAFASPFARNGEILIEQFIPGIEMTLEGLCFQGEHRVLAMSDKYKPELRTRVATSLNYPAFFSQKILRRVKDLVNAAVAAIGLGNCATHTEIIVDPDGKPFLIEIGARGGGGHIFSTIVEAVSGVNMPLALADLLCGKEPDWEPRHLRGACYRFFTPPPGTIRAIAGLDQAQTLEGVLDIGMFKEVGQQVGELVNSQERSGFVVTTGPNRDAAWMLANKVEQMVHIQVT